MANHPNEFTDTTLRNARVRQWGRCAVCGESLDDLWEHAHHLVPISAGGSAVVDNCAILCEECHHRVHYDGDFRSGVFAPASYFRYFHGH